jgi:hypothetical protein
MKSASYFENAEVRLSLFLLPDGAAPSEVLTRHNPTVPTVKHVQADSPPVLRRK